MNIEEIKNYRKLGHTSSSVKVDAYYLKNLYLLTSEWVTNGQVVHDIFSPPLRVPLHLF
jgi:hypothetical protein